MGFINDSFMLKNKTAEMLYSKVADLPIIDYHCHINPEEIADDVFLTGYANGVQVAVNYTEKDVTVQDQVIPARGFSKCDWKEVTADEA